MFYINENNEKKMLCDLQLATVKDCYDKGVDREKSFMIILSNQTSYLFKTETKEEKQNWSTQLQIVLSLILEKGNLDEINPFAITYENKVELEKLYNVCADCGESNPVWLSVNLCLFMCHNCSGTHRELGVHISQVRSIQLDQLNSTVMEMFKYFTPEASNRYFFQESSDVYIFIIIYIIDFIHQQHLKKEKNLLHRSILKENSQIKH